MWTMDQNRCVNTCPKAESCPDRKVIQKTIRKLLDDLDEHAGGSRAGIIVVVCRDQEITATQS